MSASAVGLQTDLPTLASLAFNLGAGALKKYAEAGVHVHTLQSMDEIAEICPASLEYRKEINACRQRQRKQSIWLYKVVEIGTASNFLADELLKNRAGENIVAIMSTVLPILADDDCDAFILGLFEACRAADDKTPGLGQLHGFREAILPLAQKVSFKDRTYQYHFLLGRLQGHAPKNPETSIPDVKTLVHVVSVLHKLVSEETSKYILTYRGWKGAAWVIAYARHVLGLTVCVLKTEHESIPINGTYQDSKVFVYLSDHVSRCELLGSGNISELVVATDVVERTQWVVDIANLSLRKLYFPDNRRSVEAASVIIKSLTLYFTRRRANSLNDRDHKDLRGLIPYTVACLPRLNQRALEIIEMMGFDSSLTIKVLSDTWQDYFQAEEWQAQSTKDYGFRPPYRFRLRPNSLWMECFPFCGQDQFGNPFGHEGELIIRRMFLLADIASCLAFSNWGKNLSTLSTKCLEHGLPKTHASGTVVTQNTSSGDPPSSTYLAYELDSLYRQSVFTLSEAMTAAVMIEETERVSTTIAFESQNTVVARAAASQISIDLDGIFFHFFSGHIKMLGQRRTAIISHIGGSDHYFTEIYHQFLDYQWSNNDHVPLMKPFNFVPQLILKATSRLSRAAIEVNHSLALDDQVFQFSGPDFSNTNSLETYVTGTCSHTYDEPATYDDVQDRTTQMGLILGTQPVTKDERVEWMKYIQLVDRNPCGQWASVHCSLGNCMRILQRDSCTRCALDLVQEAARSLARVDSLPYRIVFYIIQGRRVGETFGDAGSQEHHPSSQ